MNTEVLELMQALEGEGWEFKLTSRLLDDQREYVAQVWHADGLGGGRKSRNADPCVALRAAHRSASTIRRNRSRNWAARGAG